MDTSKPPKRRLSSFFSLVIHPGQSARDKTHKSSSSQQQQPQDVHETTCKRDSRLRRLGQGIRRWRHGRKKGDGAHEGFSYQHTKADTTLTNSSSSQGSLGVHDQEHLTKQPDEVVESGSASAEQEEVGMITVDEIILGEAGTQQQAIIPSSKLDTPVVDATPPQKNDSNEDEIKRNGPSEEETASSAETELAIVEKVPSSVDKDVVADEETALDALTPISTPQSVYIRERKAARQFANGLFVPSPAAKNFSNKLIFWTDASMRMTKNGNRGGTSVARQQDGHWKVEYAHVVGINAISLLEALAILMALRMAIHNCRGTESVFVLSDGASCLTWLAKVLALFPAMEQANRELQESKCYARAVVSFSQAFGFSKFDKYPGNDLQAVVCLQILEAYSKLRQLGAMVEFHWVPGHSGVVGNVIADMWAFNACLWFAEVSICVQHNEARVIPLQPLKIPEPWRANCSRLSSKRPAVGSLSQILEGVKHSQYVLRVESTPLPRTPAPAAAPKEIGDSKGQCKPKLKKSRPKCSACKKWGHVRGQCKLSAPCGLCQKAGHKEETCQLKVTCPLCGETGHRRRQCPKNKKWKAVAEAEGVVSEQARPSSSLTIPEASLVVGLLHPTLMGKPLHGARSTCMLVGQVGLDLKLRPSVAAQDV